MKKFLLILVAVISALSFIGCGRFDAVVYEVADVVSEYHYYTDSGRYALKNKEKFKKYPLRVHFIDVGQADSAFLELPDGKTMLIDAGNPENAEDVISFVEGLDYDCIDFVVATHPHADHIGAMAEVLKHFDIGSVFMPEKEHTSKTFEKMIDVIEKKEIPLYAARKGAVITETEDYSAVILSPAKNDYDDLNNFSAVVKLTYGETKYLFMGDAEKKIETELKKLDIEADVLKLGHHGSNTSSGQEFLQMVSPEYTVIPCGEDNSYGHPHEEVVKRLKRLGYTYFRTDILGTISICADSNENFTVIKEKN